MRLTPTLLKYRPEFMGHIVKYPGFAYHGVHKFIPPVTGMAKYFMMRQIWYEEEVMQYLKKPYISEKQEQALLQYEGRAHPHHQDEWMFKKLVKPEQQTYAADFLKRLDVSRSFEHMDDDSNVRR